MTRRVAAFDFDGTLTPRDTVLPFLRQLYGTRRLLTSAAVAGPPWRLADDAHRRDEFKARLLHRLTGGDDADRVTEHGVRYAERLEPLLIARMVERVAEHRRAGHEVVAVSASLRAYLEPLLLGRLGFDAVLAVGLQVGADGRLTGHMAGPNVRGPQKVVELRRWLGTDDSAEVWAYGNSSGDAELLAFADHATLVGGRGPLELPSLPG